MYQAKFSDRVTIDSGNVKAKTIISGKKLPDIPNVIKRVHSLPKVSDDNLSTQIDRIFDELTVNITSNAIDRGGLVFIGKRALMHAPAIAMPIKNGKKYESDVTIITTLGIIAAEAVARAYKENGELPVSIECQDVISSMIPATQAEPINCEFLERRYLNNGQPHVVIVHVGYQQVHVSITFVDAKVTMEGLPAIYFIAKKPDEVDSESKGNEILASIRELYAADPGDDDRLKAWKAKVCKMELDELVQQRSLALDIGAGTSDLPVMNGFVPDRERSEGIEAGVGHAEESAARALNEELGNNLSVTRHQFDDILLDKLHPHHATAVELMETANYEQAEFIFNKFTERYQEIGGNAGLFIVYGGGSITFRKYLLPMMFKFSCQVRGILLWIKPEHAPYVNRDGLDIISEEIFFPESVLTPAKEYIQMKEKSKKLETKATEIEEGEGNG